MPTNPVGELLAGFERLGEINPHHGVDDALLELAPSVIGQGVDLEATVECFPEKEGFKGFVGHLAQRRRLAGLVPHRSGSVFIPVELHPDIPQGMGRAIVINNASGAREEVLLLFKIDLKVVVGPLLPIFGSGSSGGNPRLGGRGPNLLHLTERVLVKFDGMGEARGNEPEKNESNLHILRWDEPEETLTNPHEFASLKKITQSDSGNL